VSDSPSVLSRFVAWRPLPAVIGGGLFALVMGWTLLATPRYRSEALLQVQQARSSGMVSEMLADLPAGDLLGLGKDDLETQVGVLRSRRVLDAVIDSLGLDIVVVEPRAAGEALVSLKTQRVPGQEVEAVITLRRGDAGRWTVSAEDLKPALTLVESIGSADTLRVGPHSIALLPALASSDVATMRLQISPRYETRRRVESRLDVRRQGSGADLIALSFDDPDPLRAAAALDRLLAEYLDFARRAARGDAGTTVSELRRQVEEQRRQLSAAEDALRRHQEATGLVLPSEQGAAQVKRYAALRGTLDQLEVEREALSRLIALVEQRARESSDAAATYRQLATFPTLISNRAIQDMLQALLAMENDRSALRVVRSDENADVRQLTSRIREIETDLLRISRQYLESLDGQLAPTRAALAAVDAELGALPEQELRFIRLLRERTILNEGYVALQQQLRLTEVQDALRLDDIRVVDAPEASSVDDPYFPRVGVHLAIALLLAFAGAGAVALGRSAILSGE
jgi:uncharacterized protein involved in exopolysaccharide biosynthesis